MQPLHVRPKRGRGVYALIFAVVLFVGVVLSGVVGINHQTLAPFSQAARSPYVVTTDPITAAVRGLSPDLTLMRPLETSPSIRAILVTTDSIELVAGGSKVRAIPTPKGAHTLHQIVAAVGDTTWVSEVGSVVTLSAALVVRRGGDLTIAAPETTLVQMVNLPGVLIGATGAALRFGRVRVVAVDQRGFIAQTGPSAYRPFVLAIHAAVLTADRTIFSDLGYDWNGSYGVSWMDGATGWSHASEYRQSFIGVYTDHVNDLRFDSDTFRDNRLYGIDPHSFSSGLSITNCLAAGNGAHGIIFSDGVTYSSIRHCTSRGNGENGIMMDEFSSYNEISSNIVEANRGDGIVLSHSPNNAVQYNRVVGNRVGVQFGASSVLGSYVTGNVVVNNVLASQGVALAPANTVSGNGGQWRLDRLRDVWMGMAVLLALWLLITWLLRRRRGTYHLVH